VAGIALAVVLGVIAVNVFGAGRTAAPIATDAVADPGSTIVIAETVPTPVLTSATEGADGSSVNFAWSNPQGKPTDSYVWQRTDGAGDSEKVPTADASATVSNVSPGTKVCIDVYVLRSGQLSPTPLSACYP
jgi:hypothetical protein